ncbi:hypothetical protein K2P47_04260 [Patescibacteria group bacterium]|nr:hypothetical protein [Patescibacteria group bacterium]
MGENIEANDYGAWERERQEYLATLRSLPAEIFAALTIDQLEDWQLNCYQEVKSERAVGVIRSNVTEELLFHRV